MMILLKQLKEMTTMIILKSYFSYKEATLIIQSLFVCHLMVQRLSQGVQIKKLKYGIPIQSFVSIPLTTILKLFVALVFPQMEKSLPPVVQTKQSKYGVPKALSTSHLLKLILIKLIVLLSFKMAKEWSHVVMIKLLRSGKSTQ